MVQIDDYLSDSDISFAKFEVNGFEYEALRGTEKVISKNKPDMTIAIYHNLEDMIRIPLYIKPINPQYSLYVREYGNKHTGPINTFLYVKNDER